MTYVDGFIVAVPKANLDAYLEMATAAGNGHVVDFMIASPLTAEDRNYWDMLHYRTSVTPLLSRAMAEAVQEKRDKPGLYRYFGQSG